MPSFPHRATGLFRTIAGITAVIALGACSESSDSDESAAIDSHRTMVAALERVRVSAYRDTRYFSDHKQLLALREALAKQDSNTPFTVRFNALYDLTLFESEQGNVDEAVRHGKAAERIFRQPQLKLETLDSLKLLIAQSYLRLAEDQNCCANPNGETCIFPIRGGGIHRKEEGSRKALPYLYAVSTSQTATIEDRMDATWLISIAAMTLGEYPLSVPELHRLSKLPGGEEDAQFPLFKNIAPSLGLDRFGASGGLVVDDFRNDGSISVINSVWDPATELGFYQQKEDGGFARFSEEANLTGINGGLNLRHADFDNDGDLDVLILRGAWLKELGRHPNSLLRNDGAGENGVVQFTDVAFASGIAFPAYPTQTAEWADFDLDGDLDLFVGNETKGGFRAPCQLFRNDGIGEDGVVRFVDVAGSAGLEVFAYVKGASWGDFNNDRFPDLYVSCYGEKNHLYQNRGDGTFTDVAEVLGVTDPKASFPVWFWDYNNDGHLDLFVTAFVWHNGPFLFYYQGKPPDPRWFARLYRNDGDGRFDDVTKAAGLEVPMMTMGCNFADLDNNGYPDMYLGTGNPSLGGTVPNQLLMNENGVRFSDRTTASGMGHLQKGHGVSFADFDADGDLDVFEQLGGAYRADRFYDAVFENPGFGNHWLEVRLRGKTSNSYGIGCRLRAVIDSSEGERSVYAWMNSGSSFGSNPLVAHIGLADATVIKRLEIFWPVTGMTQSFSDVAVDQRIVVSEGDDSWKKVY